MSFALATNGFEEAKKQAAGRWAAIIEDLYPEISQALVSPGRSRCACPIHGSAKGRKADGFRLLPDFHQSGGAVCNTCGVFPTGIDLICFLENTTDPKRGLEILESYLGINRHAPVTPRKLPAPITVHVEKNDPKAIKRRKKVLSDIWDSSIPLSQLPDDHQAIRYFLETRGIADLTMVKAQKNIRFNLELFYKRNENADAPPITFPGIVSMMHNAEGKAKAIHRTYLHEHLPIAAGFDDNKKILGRLEETLNGAIRLYGRAPFSHHANVCEGIETGLSVCYSTGQPVFAAGNTTLLASWVPPEGVKCVTVWCDRDANEAGMNHARKLKTRMAASNIACRILLPDYLASDNEDWNNVLLECGYNALEAAYLGTSMNTRYH